MSAAQSGNWRQNDNWRTPGPARSSEPDPAPHAAHASRPSPRQQPNTHQREASSVDASAVPDSIAEGRRIYLGNLLYRVKPPEIDAALESAGFAHDLVEGIHISVDAVTGRNPGYCFIDFTSRETASAALESLGGVVIQGRAAKVGPCQPKGAERRWRRDGYTPTFQRWGDWMGEGGARLDGAAGEQGPYGALRHLRELEKVEAPPRVWVGGLGPVDTQAVHDREMQEWFSGFKIIAISKRITAPQTQKNALSVNRNYCFIDFENRDEAQAAIEALDGRVMAGGARLRARMAKQLFVE